MKHLEVYIFIALIVVAAAAPKKRPYRDLNSDVVPTVAFSKPKPINKYVMGIDQFARWDDNDEGYADDIKKSHDGPEDENDEEYYKEGQPPRRRRKHIVTVVVQNDVDSELSELSEFAKCCICYEGYNKTARVPISMTCGHTLCKRCVGRLHSDIFFCCPVCRGVTILHKEWGKNLALLQFMEKLGLLAPDDDAPVPTPSPGPNHRQYMHVLDGITYKDAFRYTWSFFDIMTDYIAYKSQDWVEDMKDRMYQMFDDFSAKVEPVLRAFLCLIGWNTMADNFKRENEEYSVNGETIEDYYERITCVNGASGDGAANVKGPETNETDGNAEEVASEM